MNEGNGASCESMDLNPIARGKVELIGAACPHRSEAEQTEELEHLQLNQSHELVGAVLWGWQGCPGKGLMVGLINPAATAMLSQLGPSPDSFMLPVGNTHPAISLYLLIGLSSAVRKMGSVHKSKTVAIAPTEKGSIAIATSPISLKGLRGRK